MGSLVEVTFEEHYNMQMMYSRASLIFLYHYIDNLPPAFCLKTRLAWDTHHARMYVSNWRVISSSMAARGGGRCFLVDDLVAWDEIICRYGWYNILWCCITLGCDSWSSALMVSGWRESRMEGWGISPERRDLVPSVFASGPRGAYKRWHGKWCGWCLVVLACVCRTYMVGNIYWLCKECSFSFP